MFDTDMSPLPFNVDKMYHFMEERFEGTSAAVQEQNLEWLQVIFSLICLIFPLMYKSYTYSSEFILLYSLF